MREYEPLRQFLELARVLHFGRAAHACHLSPSALSRSVQRLEAQLGEPLFEREHRRVALTLAGEAFRRHAMTVLEEWEQFAQGRAGDRDSLRGTVRVYCTVTAAQSIVPDLLARVRRSHPGIRIELETGYAADAIDRLRSGDIDVSVAALPGKLPTDVVSRPITRTPLVFAGPSTEGPIYDAISTRPIRWPSVPIVLPAHGLVREYAEDWFIRRAINPNVYAEIEGHEAILSLVALGCGVGVVPRLVLENSALRDRLMEIPVRPSLQPLHIALCVRQRSLSNPLVAAVWDS